MHLPLPFYHSIKIAQENSSSVHKDTGRVCYTFIKSFRLKGACSLYEPTRLCRTFPQKDSDLAAGARRTYRHHRAAVQGQLGRDHRSAFAAVRMAGAGGAGHRPQLPAAGGVRGVGHRAQPHPGASGSGRASIPRGAAPLAMWSRWAQVQCRCRHGICTAAACRLARAWA